MSKILLFGAGKSATCLISYLVRETAARGWKLVVADANLDMARSKTGTAEHVSAIALDVENETERDARVREADIVISLLPPTLHYLVALSCIKWKTDLLTASYLDDKIKALEPAIRENGLLFICEMGLDPGIDHMSAMQMIHRIQSTGRITSFRSHTGGLVAPESDTNPWHYKISWNPRNVVMAGSAGASYKEDNVAITRTYQELFENCREVSFKEFGLLAWYPNRDSLSYLPLYGLEDVSTFIRTTLRYQDFCRAWKDVVRAGLTNDTLPVGDAAGPDTARPLTFAGWSSPILPFVSAENRKQLEFLGLFDAIPVPPAARTSADILQYLLETRLSMQPHDKDMIVMQHEIGFVKDGTHQEERSTLIVVGENATKTAMAKTVGLPLGITAMLILDRKISLRGLHIPILPEIYTPVLRELEGQGIVFETVMV